MANEPRAYRESISEALCALRPDVGVTSVQPGVLEKSVALHAPHVVVCSEVVPIVRETVPIWIELYPGHSSKSIVSIEGRRTEIEDIQLPELLSIVDRAYELAQLS
ncbi:MAG: hypothetical protein WA982_14435 [Rubrobacteraceae bacterium]